MPAGVTTKIATPMPYCTVNVQFFKHKPLIINKTLYNFIFTKTVHFYKTQLKIKFTKGFAFFIFKLFIKLNYSIACTTLKLHTKLHTSPQNTAPG